MKIPNPLGAVKRMVPSMPRLPGLPGFPKLPGIPKVPGLSKLPGLPGMPKLGLPSLKKKSRQDKPSLPSGNDAEERTPTVAELATETVNESGEGAPAKSKALIDAPPSSGSDLAADKPSEAEPNKEQEPQLTPAEMGLPDMAGEAGSLTLNFDDAGPMVAEPSVSASQRPPMTVPTLPTASQEAGETGGLVPPPAEDAKPQGKGDAIDDIFADDDMMALFEEEAGGAESDIHHLAGLVPDIDVNELLIECQDIRDRLATNRAGKVKQHG